MDDALPRLLARTAAGAAAGCAAMHGAALVAAPHPARTGTAVLAAVCLLCAAHLWRRGGPVAWGLHVVLTATMLLTHLPSTGHGHAVAVAGLAAWAGPVAGLLATVALLLAAVRGCDALRPTLASLGQAIRRSRSTAGARRV